MLLLILRYFTNLHVQFNSNRFISVIDKNTRGYYYLSLKNLIKLIKAADEPGYYR
jgi:hypothetical protein